LITLFGIVYVISQITIIVILGPIEEAMINLQTTGVSSAPISVAQRVTT